MKVNIFILLLLFTNYCWAQVQGDDFKLSISPAVNIDDTETKEIIAVLSGFLQTKNNSLSENEFWLRSDFNEYVYPYKDIFHIEKSKFGANYFKPSLMEVITISSNDKLLKVAFIGLNPETNETSIRCIYNMVATKVSNQWKLKRSINYQTTNWKKQKEGSITYYFPQNKTGNIQEIERQKKDILNICSFFNAKPIDITYYSCNNVKQVFEVKGFDYLPNMYFSSTGGMADLGNIVYSGNNSEYYTHEIIHIYTRKLFPKINAFIDEGIATYIGGSGLNSYTWHRDNLKNYLETCKINFSEHLNTYERFYINEETPIPYMIGALICERTYRIYGKNKLFELLKSDKELWNNLKDVGLTRQNLTAELLKEINRLPTTYQ